MVARESTKRTAAATPRLGPMAHPKQACGPFSGAQGVPMECGTGTRTEEIPTHGYYSGKLRDLRGRGTDHG